MMNPKVLFSLILLLNCIFPSNGLSIGVYKQDIIEIQEGGLGPFSSLSGDISKQIINITQCTPVNASQFGDDMEIETYGNCFNIYQEKQDCTGNFIRYQAGQLLTGLDKLEGHRWDGEIKLKGERIQIKSIGPCFDKCDSRNWAGIRDEDNKTPVSVTIYEDEDFVGNSTTILVQGDGCYPFNSQFAKKLESMKISGTEFNSCVELHNEASCGGGFTQFRPGHLYLHDLWFWGMQGQDIAVYAQAVSRCGVYCNKTVPEIKAETDLDKSPGQNMITIYDYKGYYGNPTHIQLTPNACTNLTHLKTTSLKTYGLCVVLYESQNCTQTRGYYSLQTDFKDSKYYLDKIFTSTIPLVIRTNSIKLCDQEDNQITSMSSSSSNEKENYEKCHPSSHSSLEILFLIFVLLIIICCSFLSGAWLFKRYSNSVNNTQSTQGERFNVVYQLQS